MIHLSGAELSASIIIVILGIIGSLKLFFNSAAKEKIKKWNFFIYGAAIIVLLSGLFTPPDLFSNAIFSVPFITIYGLIIWTIVFRRRNNRNEAHL